jgi:DNA-binding MarR family transcriptional regulator
MTARKKLIEEIMASFHAMRNKMQTRAMHSGPKDCVTHSQLFVSGVIEQHRGIGIKEISKRMGISSSATTQLVDGLVEKGYVMRRADSKDRRALHLKLSTKGKKHIAELRNKRMKMIAVLFNALDDGELETYLKLHKKILSKANI